MASDSLPTDWAALQTALFDECEEAGWDPEKLNSFGDETAHLHEEISEAFRAFRKSHGFAIYWTCKTCGRTVDAVDKTVQHPESLHHYTLDGMDCRGQFKPEGVPIEHADVLIGMFYNAELHGYSLMDAVAIKHEYNLARSYPGEGRHVHGQ